jgi:hypothetical protein
VLNNFKLIDVTYFEIIICSVGYQLALYIAIRLAHRGFTVGELGLVCFGGVALGMEMLNITKASVRFLQPSVNRFCLIYVQIWPVTTSFMKTYRLATPLLVLQVALIAGSFLVGFLLSPLLWLSRHIAQRPVRRLRFPQEKQRYQRGLAAGFYAGSILIIGGLIGMWSRWCLNKRDPWLWVMFWILEGRSRPLLLAYWGLLGSISVAGWNRQLARSRRYRPRNAVTGKGENVIVPVPEEPTSSSFESNGSLVGGLNFPNLRENLPNLPNLPSGANVSLRATDFLDAADKHVPTLGLNARRKFFHALAVAMFLPGIAFDVSLFSLSSPASHHFDLLRLTASPLSRTYHSAPPLLSLRLQNTSATLLYTPLEPSYTCSCTNFWITRTAVPLF